MSLRTDVFFTGNGSKKSITVQGLVNIVDFPCIASLLAHGYGPL